MPRWLAHYDADVRTTLEPYPSDTLIDYLWPLWDGENRCLHDMVVSTHVVH